MATQCRARRCVLCRTFQHFRVWRAQRFGLVQGFGLIILLGLLRNRNWANRWTRGGVSPEFRQFVKTEFGIRVRNGAWYKQAMTHGSMMAELEPGEQSNERLEFLGDSILGAVAAELVERSVESGVPRSGVPCRERAALHLVSAA